MQMHANALQTDEEYMGNKNLSISFLLKTSKKL